MISSRLTAWENLLDSVSHIGPLTNNPAEAKRLQVIRPDQNAPLAQKLSPKMDPYQRGKSKKNKNKNRKKNKIKKNKQSQIDTRTKDRKGESSNGATKMFNLNHGKGFIIQDDKVRRVRRQ